MESRWQLLREWPPGYGGVERVAHELATIWKGPVFSFDVTVKARRSISKITEPLPVNYVRHRLRCVHFSRLSVPLPSLSLLKILSSSVPLHGHLPSPGVLLILLFARLFRPKRFISIHWHAFLESPSNAYGFLVFIYQHFALFLLPLFSEIVATSPIVAKELCDSGHLSGKVRVLPCCLDQKFESAALALPLRRSTSLPTRVLFIGRLNSYKRLDWLITALSTLNSSWRLDVVGDGSKREIFESQAKGLPVYFHGLLDEASKLNQLSKSHLLVLPSDSSNEAFGIVQLEAMAAGVPSLAFARKRSGMGWVGMVQGFKWSQKPDDLAEVLETLVANNSLLSLLSEQARDRYLLLFSREVWMKKLVALCRH